MRNKDFNKNKQIVENYIKKIIVETIEENTNTDLYSKESVLNFIKELEVLEEKTKDDKEAWELVLKNKARIDYVVCSTYNAYTIVYFKCNNNDGDYQFQFNSSTVLLYFLKLNNIEAHASDF